MVTAGLGTALPGLTWHGGLPFRASADGAVPVGRPINVWAIRALAHMAQGKRNKSSQGTPQSLEALGLSHHDVCSFTMIQEEGTSVIASATWLLIHESVSDIRKSGVASRPQRETPEQTARAREGAQWAWAAAAKPNRLVEGKADS